MESLYFWYYLVIFSTYVDWFTGENVQGNTHAVFRFPIRFFPNKLSNDLIHTLMRWNQVEISLETRLDNDRFRIVQGVGEVCL